MVVKDMFWLVVWKKQKLLGIHSFHKLGIKNLGNAVRMFDFDCLYNLSIQMPLLKYNFFLFNCCIMGSIYTIAHDFPQLTQMVINWHKLEHIHVKLGH